MSKIDGRPLHFKGTKIYKNVKNERFFFGDTTKNDGTGGESIFGKDFGDEKLRADKSFERPYMMGYPAPNKKTRDANNSKVFITYDTMY